MSQAFSKKAWQPNTKHQIIFPTEPLWEQPPNGIPQAFQQDVISVNQNSTKISLSNLDAAWQFIQTHS